MQETQETQVCSLGCTDPLEEEMATHSSILAWKIPLTEEPGGLQSIGLQRVRHDWAAEHKPVLKELDTTDRLHFVFFFPLEPKSVWLEFSHFLQVVGEVSAGVRLPDIGPVHIERPLRAHVVRAQPWGPPGWALSPPRPAPVPPSPAAGTHTCASPGRVHSRQPSDPCSRSGLLTMRGQAGGRPLMLRWPLPRLCWSGLGWHCPLVPGAPIPVNQGVFCWNHTCLCAYHSTHSRLNFFKVRTIPQRSPVFIKQWALLNWIIPEL